MNRTNRFLNRLVILLCGLVLIAAGAYFLLSALAADWAQRVVKLVQATTDQAIGAMNSWEVPLADGRSIPGSIVVALAVALVLVILLIVFLTRHGGGRTSTVMRTSDERGSVTVDRNVLSGLIADTLGERSDVLSAKTHTFDVKKRPTVELSIVPRSGASLPRVLHAAESAVEDWDRLAGRRDPVLVHLCDRGWLTRYRSATRVR